VLDILGAPNRITMITPGVDTRIFYPGPRPEWIGNRFQVGNDSLIVTVGRLVKKKGHETVLRSLPAVLKRFPQVKYLIAGDGPERERLENLANGLGLTACVRFAGNVPNYNVGDFYRAADIFCLLNQEDATGDIESFGMVFIEAGATGKPVVGGRSGGTAQSIIDGRTGMLCEPGNSSQLSDLLILLLSRCDLRKRMGDSGLMRARDDFNWQSRVEQLLEVHKSIIPTAPRNSGDKEICFQH
jgi:phosphatidylinositol alpha-1,6-mannosyltransferase